MKKNFQKLISFFMLLAMIITINPIPTIPEDGNEPEIETCSDDEIPTDVIAPK